MKIQDLIKRENEKPLDNIAVDGGYTAIFRTVAVIGDSLSSGEFETADENGVRSYHDMYEHSWGQYIARMCSSKVYNFSRGGMTATWYCKSFAEENGFWNKNLASQAYIIALGVNDLYNNNNPVGDINDIDFNNYRNNKENFAGYYAQIIQRYKEISPDAKFFLMTMPRETGYFSDPAKKIAHQKLLYDLCERFDNTYIIDLFEYAPIYDDDFKKKFFLLSHMNPMGYLFTAKIVASYIDYIIRHNYEDFMHVGFITKDIKY